MQDLETDPAYPTREDKARRFMELMGDAKGASRAIYFRVRQRLEGEQRLVVQPAPPVPLRNTRRPAAPSQLELDAMAAAPPPEPEDEPRPPDVPAPEEFAQPIRGQGPQPPAPPRIVLDDLLPGEAPPETDEDPEE